MTMTTMILQRIKDVLFQELSFRVIAYIAVAFGALLVLGAAWDQYRGITLEPHMRGYIHDRVSRDADPERFRGAMEAHWFIAFGILGAGVILRSIIRGVDRSDPLSSEFSGNKALDEWGEALKEEEERQRHKTP